MNETSNTSQTTEDMHRVAMLNVYGPHAIVNKDGYDVPLIGVHPGAVLEECDLCHEEQPLRDLTWTGTQMLCEKCRLNDNNKAVAESTLRMVLADLIAAYEREVNPAPDWRDTALTYSEWLDATAEYRAAKAVLDSPYKSEA